MRVQLDHTEQLSPQIRTFWFKPERPLAYTAGQYIELTVHHAHPDDRGEKHWFTLSSPPGHELVSITTRYAGDEKSSSFKKALFSLVPGTELHMSEAQGDFVLPKDASVPLVFVAGGIGLTPFHSIFEWLADNNEQRHIQFIYGVRSEEDIIFQDTFARAGIHATIVVSEPTDTWGGERGRLSAELVAGLANIMVTTLVYISGPEPMVQALATHLAGHGVQQHQIVTDDFPGYTAI